MGRLLRLAAAGLMGYASYRARSGFVAWGALGVALVWIFPRLMVGDEHDPQWQAVVACLRSALAECGMSLKCAALEMGMRPADLTNALQRKRSADLLYRLLKLPANVQQTFHLNCLVMLGGLPTRTKRMLKIAAVIDGMQERSA